MDQFIKLYFSEKKNLFDLLDLRSIKILVEKVIATYEKDGIVFTLGNGGGASVANGFAVDLKTHPFTHEDKSLTTEIRRLKVIDFSESNGILTGISNDIGPEFMFSEQFKNWAIKGNPCLKDNILIAFSGSGNSKNVLLVLV